MGRAIPTDPGVEASLVGEEETLEFDFGDSA